MRRDGRRAALTLGTLLVFAGSAEAQLEEGLRGFVGISFVAANPVGPLGAFFDQGFGAQIQGGVQMGAQGRLRLRGDLGVLVYGHERLQLCYALPVGCRIGLDLTTTNTIIFAGIGPEFVLATGALEPYVYATTGISYFATMSSLSGADEPGGWAETTNYSDAVMAWKVGGGLRVRVRGGRNPISLDLGVERHQNGIADFLTEGDILDHPDGSITLFPNRSEANLMTFRFGVSVGLRGR